ncbi:hypothetical protein MKY29_11900 [Psychrobacillus sp. FSL K6-2365]|uniref:hypothetical protein n=1 Tax=Psychrobacillus sp. FSL K6-2365 TaxID=2921546 RepID=UPI0030F992F2
MTININGEDIYAVPFESREEAINYQKDNENVVTENYEQFYLIKKENLIDVIRIGYEKIS